MNAAPAPATGRLRASCVSRPALPPAVVQAMWELYAEYYEDVSEEVFRRDLGAKQFVILLRDSGDGALRGFSTLQVYDQPVGGRRCVAVFTGDTVIDQAYWGQRALPRAFFRFLMQTKLRYPFTPVFWFLISKGYKTYLFLTRNVPRHYPRWNRPTPAWEQQVLDTLARERFGEAYDAQSGVVRFSGPSARVKSAVAGVDERAMQSPDVRFFLERNAGYARGEELCCLGRVDFVLPLHFLGRQLVPSARRQPRRKPSGQAA